MQNTPQPTFKEFIHKQTRTGELYRQAEDGRIECFACGHRCLIAEGREGICKVRYNLQGKLQVPFGYVGSLQVDPVEKKPFFHALPGSLAMSFGMLGCDYHCAYCQNWITSQALRDPIAISGTEELSPEQIVALAQEHRASIVTSTYNEPLITSEWGVEVFKAAKRHDLVTSYVSNGNGTPEVIKYLRPWVDLYKVDLKGFNDKRYRTLGGVLKNVLDTIVLLHELKFWVEVVTLFVPRFNDSEEEMREIARFLCSVSPDIPWHVTAFHSDYKMEETEKTPARTIMRAAQIGYESGLRYVYAGNLPGGVGNFENTYCHSCHALLIERIGFRIKNNFLIEGKCPKCQAVVPGFWKRPGAFAGHP